MKNLLIGMAIVFMASFGQAAYILHPKSGDQYKCLDSVSGFTYLMKILDIGDEEGEVKVFNRMGKLVDHYGPRQPTKYAQVELNRGGMQFILFANRRYAGTINFEVFDLHTAYYADRGDSRALDCKVMR